MSLHQHMPDLDGSEFAALREDIRKNGVLVPVEVDEDGHILDGHNRAAIADELGIDYERRVVTGLANGDKREYAIRVNAIRRQMSPEKRRPWVASLYVEEGMTQQQIADVLGVTQRTVSNDLAFSNVSKTDPRGRPPKPPEPEPDEDNEPEPAAQGEDGDDEPDADEELLPELDDEGESDAAGELAEPEPEDGDDEPAPPKPQRRALPDQFFDACHDLTKVVDRIDRLVNDDRFPRNAEQVALKHRSDLLRANDALAKALARLPEG